jgi:hypothetical protein
MGRTLDAFEQVRNVVEIEAGPKAAEVARARPDRDDRRLRRPRRIASFTTSRNERPDRRASARSFAATSSSSVNVVRT